MSKKLNKLTAETREGKGKGAARALRREGKTPAIVYGGNKDELKIATDSKELFKAFVSGNFKSKLIELDLGKEKINVIPCDIQLHPVSDVPLHADFKRVNNDSKVHVWIHVNFLNTDVSPGLKRGGVLNIVRREIELICRADSIPTKLEVDLSKTKIGETIHAHDLTFPDGVEPAIKDRDFTIATIVGRTTKTEEEEDEEAAAALEAAENAEAEGEESSEEDSAE